MPHLIIEYSDEIAGQVDLDAVVDAAHAGALASGLFPEYDIKTRAIGYTSHRTGQTRDSFVHLTLRLLSGRDDTQKAALSETVLAAIEPLLPEVVSVGVEIVDMHRESYRKRVLEAG
ncbi:MAG: 5-carboxymethyl-2-hydroxymuconate Delta-isomerase [Gammaproteobacteria bacterium]|nr:5-carboxymethyl-2-hydroxymuconate Delta-isomerase [Gammaproteobacteria bacterium]